ncbi:MAG: hypothetical protein RI985_1202 [Chloroflexota bacterium]|jgi:hypothetical protein
MVGIEGFDAVTLVILFLSVAIIVATGGWFLYNRGAYTRALKQLARTPNDETIVQTVIRTGRDFYFDQHMYAQLPPNSLLQKMSQLARMRQGNPHHFDVQVRNEMVARTGYNYDSRFPHLTPDEKHKTLPKA